VARLKRGWIGCFVTTSTFSKKAQEEVIEDRYPMILVAGVQVARAVDEMARDAGISVEDLLLQIDAGYEDAVKNRNPEQILL
jgi:restriction endonuclease Mrr